jgi:hypothetical protein|tara:strand:+ start:5848 stop:6537 length:690 start_codon:yes stop_codon:yes gene_type:complete
MICLRTEVYEKLMAYAHAAEPYSGEVGGLGYVTIEDEHIFVDDVILVEQEACVGSADITEGLYKLIAELNDEQKEKLKLFWHSHGKNSTFWSGQDEEAIEALLNFYDWFVSIEVNVYGSMIGRVDTAVPIPMRQDVTTRVITTEDAIEKVRKEVEEKVERRLYSNRGVNSYSEFSDRCTWKKKKGSRITEYYLADGSKFLTKDEPIEEEITDDDDEFTELGFLQPWSHV